MADISSEHTPPTVEVTVFVHRPSDDIRAARSPAMTALGTIVDRLPAPPAAVVEGVRRQTIDYPHLNPEWVTGNWVCHDGHDRPVFCIEGTAYFRRYNDNWNPLVIEGEIVSGVLCTWKTGGISDVELIRLAGSL